MKKTILIPLFLAAVGISIFLACNDGDWDAAHLPPGCTQGEVDSFNAGLLPCGPPRNYQDSVVFAQNECECTGHRLNTPDTTVIIEKDNE